MFYSSAWYCVCVFLLGVSAVTALRWDTEHAAGNEIKADTERKVILTEETRKQTL